MPRISDPPHARIYRSWLDLPAWRTLSTFSKCLLTEMLARYRPWEPNQFEVSDRTASQLIGCSRNTARIALEELEDRGWIKVIRVGKITGPRTARASVYALTYYPISNCEPALKTFLHWQPHPVQQLKSGPSTAQIRPFNGSLQCLEGSFSEETKCTAKH
jgi:DNA-binding transcriptional MocR family regulator